MFASTHKLNNLTLIIDYNKFQGFGATNEVINQKEITQRLKSFGFETFQINGNNIEKLKETFAKVSKKPIAIVANTIKGKGVSFMENKLEWHYKSPNNEQLAIALKEIDEKY